MADKTDKNLLKLFRAGMKGPICPTSSTPSPRAWS